MRIAINGFGRIGRSVFRILANQSDIEIVAINDIADNESLAYLLKFDTVMGRFPGELELNGDVLSAASQKCRITKLRDPKQLPWKELKVDVVIEATGRFRRRAEVADHLEAGAGRVILTVPAKDELDATIVLGVNDDDLKPEHRILSNASCTTNCLAPVAKILHEEFGIQKGIMTTIHAYTNDQRLSDWSHKDLRRSRAAGVNVIPTTTGAARAVGKVLPELKGKLDGMAMRVPVPNGSIVDLMLILEKECTADQINAAMHKAAQNGLKGILEYSEEALVSTDIIGNPHSSIFDAPLTQVVGKNRAKIFSWYDNEWGYSNRVVDLVKRVGQF